MKDTRYDDVFRTLINDCSRLLLPLLNEVFGEHYEGNEKITFGEGIHFMNQQDGEYNKRITDTFFTVTGKQTKQYHIECQSTIDYSMLIRFFEYDTQIALDNGTIEGNILRVSLPHSAALFLRSNQNTMDEMTVEISSPGGIINYSIPVLKIKNYTIDELFNQKLYILVPYYIFTDEPVFQDCEEHESELEKLLLKYVSIRRRIENLCQIHELTEYEKYMLMEMSKLVIEKILENYHKTKKGVAKIMSGEVLDYEAKRILNAGVKQGIEQGIEQKTREIILNMSSNGCTPKTISQLTGIGLEIVEKELGVKK